MRSMCTTYGVRAPRTRSTHDRRSGWNAVADQSECPERDQEQVVTGTNERTYDAQSASRRPARHGIRRLRRRG